MWFVLGFVLVLNQSNQSPARQTVPTVWGNRWNGLQDGQTVRFCSSTVGTVREWFGPFWPNRPDGLENRPDGWAFGLTVPTVSQTVPTVRAFSAQFCYVELWMLKGLYWCLDVMLMLRLLSIVGVRVFSIDSRESRWVTLAMSKTIVIFKAFSIQLHSI